MSSIFENFYYGNLGFQESQPTDEEFLKRWKAYCEIYDALEATLDKKQKKMLDDLFFSESGVLEIKEYLSYKEGFRVGLNLAIEMCKEL